MHGDIKDLFLKKFLEVVIDIVYSNPLKIFVFFFNKVSKCILMYSSCLCIESMFVFPD